MRQFNQLGAVCAQFPPDFPFHSGTARSNMSVAWVFLALTLSTVVVGHLRGLGNDSLPLPGENDTQPSIEWWHGRAWKVPVSLSGQPLSRRLQAGQRVISGIANTLMEDHFDTKSHFSYTIVDTTEGERLRVSLPHHEKLVNEPVRWIIEDSTYTNPFDILATLGDVFSSG
jgi:hypothetical protein